MVCRRFAMILTVLCLAVLSAPANPVSAPPLSEQTRDAQVLAAKIDELIAARWAEQGLKPSPSADDAEFMRRLYLDLAGRIPRVPEVRRFLDDPTPDKRLRLVERLLEISYKNDDDTNVNQYINHFTNTWRALMLPRANNAQFLDPNFTGWLNKQVRDNVPYDQMVREVLTATVGFNNPRAPQPVVNPLQPTPMAFYQANEQKPENLAASTSRLFLGVKLECAQCHDHPFAKYTRKQFWEYAAFFSGITGQTQNGFVTGVSDKASQRAIAIPGTDKVVQARFLDGTEPQWRDGVGTRAILAEWLTSPANPYFARSLANRTWSHFFGIGIIEPVDEPGADNPPSHPELLDLLAQQLAVHQFDPKFLIRAIVLSKTYQLSSVAAQQDKEDDPRLFHRMAIKGLTPEQLFDSLALATLYTDAPFDPNQRTAAFRGQTNARAEFLQKFASQDKRTEFQTSILQALTLMNGRFVGDATDAINLERAPTGMLASVVDFPLFDTTAKRVEALFLAALSRKPRPDELERLVKYVDAGGPKKDTRAALADVFWALLNSTEFILNH